MDADSLDLIVDAGGTDTTHASFGATTTIGPTTSEHVKITSSGLELKDGSTVRLTMDSSGIAMGNQFSVDSSGNASFSGTLSIGSLPAGTVSGSAQLASAISGSIAGQTGSLDSAISTAQSTANTGVSNAATAQGTANSAQSTANTANTTATTLTNSSASMAAAVQITSVGMNILNSSGNKLAEYGSDVFVGLQNAEHVKISSDGLELKDNTTTLGKFASTTTIGNTSTEHVEITSTSFKLKDGGTTRLEMNSSGISMGDQFSVDSSGNASFSGTLSIGSLPSGTVSGSAQVEANLPAGTVTGSAQLADAISGSSNSVSASLAADTAATLVDSASVASSVQVTSAGLNILNASGNKLAEYGSNVFVGLQNAEHVKISSSGLELKDNTTTFGKFASTTTIGNTSTEHVEITSTTLKLKDGSTTRISMDSSGVQIGAVDSGITLNSDGDATFKGTLTIGDYLPAGSVSGSAQLADAISGSSNAVSASLAGQTAQQLVDSASVASAVQITSTGLNLSLIHI